MLFFALKQRVRSVFFGVSFTKRPRHWWPQGRGPRGRQRQPVEKAVCRRASPAPSPRSAGVFLLPIPCSVLPAAAYGFRAALSAGHRGAGRRKVAGGSGAAASDAGRRVHVCRLIAPGAPGDSLACPWPRAACSRRILAADAAPFESPIRGRVMRSTEGAEGCKIMRRAMRAVRGDGFGGSGRGGWAATEGLMDNHAACNACCPGCLCAALASACPCSAALRFADRGSILSRLPPLLGVLAGGGAPVARRLCRAVSRSCVKDGGGAERRQAVH